MTATATTRTATARGTASPPARPHLAPKAPARPPLRVVDNKEAARRQHRRGVAWMGLGLLAVGLLAVVTSHVILSQQHYELERIERQAAASQRQYDQLRLDVARLEAPERIVDVATRRLGMVMPEEVTYLTPTERVVEPEASDAAAGTADAGDGADEHAVALNGPSGWASVKPHLTVAP